MSGIHGVVAILGLWLWVLPVASPGKCGPQDALKQSTHLENQNSPQSEKPAKTQQKQPEYTISTESTLVLLDVLVTDEDGNVLGGLKKENFRILDNGKAQIITQFEPTDDPITVVILLEYSGLAYDYFAYKAAYWSNAFLDHLDSKDWVALITYDVKPTIQVDFTHNKVQVRDALSTLSYPGFSEANLFDAVVDTLEKLERVKGKKAVLLITTGIDTFSRATLEDAMAKLKESDVTVFFASASRKASLCRQRCGVVVPRLVTCKEKTNWTLLPS